KMPECGGGVVHDTMIHGFPTKPTDIEKYVSRPTASGARINGTKRRGVKTTGAPNMTGSLILKTLDQMDPFPRLFKCLDLARQTNKIVNAMAIPEPPTAHQIAINGCPIICGSSSPAR